MQLIIDEIKYAPKLLAFFEQIVNKEGRKNFYNDGMFILIASVSFSYFTDILNSLVGRVKIVKMTLLSINELDSTNSKLFNGEFIKNYNKSKDYNYESINFL